MLLGAMPEFGKPGGNAFNHSRHDADKMSTEMDFPTAHDGMR